MSLSEHKEGLAAQSPATPRCLDTRRADGHRCRTNQTSPLSNCAKQVCSQQHADRSFESCHIVGCLFTRLGCIASLSSATLGWCVDIYTLGITFCPPSNVDFAVLRAMTFFFFFRCRTIGGRMQPVHRTSAARVAVSPRMQSMTVHFACCSPRLLIATSGTHFHDLVSGLECFEATPILNLFVCWL